MKIAEGSEVTLEHEGGTISRRAARVQKKVSMGDAIARMVDRRIGVRKREIEQKRGEESKVK